MAGVALCPKLWIAARDYPLAPAIPGLRLAPPFDLLLILGMLLALTAAALASRPLRAMIAAVVLGMGLVCLDQSRLQPWFYEYLLLLSALAWYEAASDGGRKAAALNGCRLLLASIYFWSGAQKLNPHFAREIAPWVAQPLLRAVPKLGPAVYAAGLATPWVEAAIGLALLWRRTRTMGIWGAIGMHGLLLVALGPWGRNHNSTIWPWNLMMMGAVVALFWRTPEVSARDILVPKGPALWRVEVAWIVAGPLLSFVGLWDSYMAWGLYSGNHARAVYSVTDTMYGRLPAGAREHVYEDSPGVNTLDIAEWSWDELNAPVYAEPRVYRAIGQALCQYAVAPADLQLTIEPRGAGPRAYDCDPGMR